MAVVVVFAVVSCGSCRSFHSCNSAIHLEHEASCSDNVKLMHGEEYGLISDAELYQVSRSMPRDWLSADDPMHAFSGGLQPMVSASSMRN